MSTDDSAYATTAGSGEGAGGASHDEPAGGADGAPVGERVGGRYLIERELGRGAYGVVAVARDTQLDRAVAVKLLARRHVIDPTGAARFRREAQLTASIASPHVAAVHEVGEVGDGRWFIAMELIDGRSLASVLDAEGALAPDRAADLVVQAARGLAAAHAVDVVHRDVKPANLLVGRRAGREHVTVIDFGVSKLVAPGRDDATLTTTGAVIGSPAYMAPEQARGDATVDARTDVHALGVVLFELVTGRLPYAGTTNMATLARVMADEPPSARTLRPELDPRIDAVIARCLAKAPAARFASAADVADALEAIRRGEATPELEPAPRRRGAVVIGVVGAVGVAISGAWFAARGPSTRPPLRLPPAAAPRAEALDCAQVPGPPPSSAELSGVYQAAEDAFQREDYLAAARGFSQLFCRAPMLSIATDAATAWSRAGRNADAVAIATWAMVLWRVMPMLPGADDEVAARNLRQRWRESAERPALPVIRADADGAVVELTPRGRAGATIRGPAGTALQVPAGTYLIRVQAPGRRAVEQAVVLVQGEQQLDYALPR